MTDRVRPWLIAIFALGALTAMTMAIDPPALWAALAHLL
jgi:hypothetical protein